EADMTFVALATDGGMRDLGALTRSDSMRWTPNLRPFFFEGRLLVLNGSEIIEGAEQGGTLREVRRLDLTGPE
ncbi:MAG: hypothetical protein ACREH4_01850, partial [Vitreimonas sp.]